VRKVLRYAAAPLIVALYFAFVMPRPQGIASPPAVCVAELWHVDMFEGGSGSRAEFLKARAVEFEKSNKGKYILVKSMTYHQILNAMAEGHYPDMFSHGHGLASDLMFDLAAFGGSADAYRNFLNSGVIDGKLYAVPWCCGCYIISAVKEHAGDGDYSKILASSGKGNLYSFITGYSHFNNPLLAAFAANVTLEEKSLDTSRQYSQYEAYSKFVTKKASVFLLGTQRDVVRISQREDASDFAFQPLKGYCDIVCYISVSKHTQNAAFCVNFTEYLLSEEAQNKLSAINMFSVRQSGLYPQGIMNLAEISVKHAAVPNAFLPKETLENSRALALNALKGDRESGEKLKQILPY
jgi:hypothetical protein